MREQATATGGHDSIADISIDGPNSTTGGISDRKPDRSAKAKNEINV